MRINNSEKKPYYTQRNNALKPAGACNVTAIIAALSAAGWNVGALSTGEFPQPEDALMSFMLTDERVGKFWKSVDLAGRFPPNEWHPVLAYGANLLLSDKGLAAGNDAVSWGEQRSTEKILDTIKKGGAAVLSGVFTASGKKTIGHVVAAVGYRTGADGQVSHLIIDDSWGDYRTGYADHNGNDIEMPMEDFMRICRPCGYGFKLAHLVRSAGGAA